MTKIAILAVAVLVLLLVGLSAGKSFGASRSQGNTLNDREFSKSQKQVFSEGL